MTARIRRLLAAGFAADVAVVLAEAGYDVRFVPLDQVLGVQG